MRSAFVVPATAALSLLMSGSPALGQSGWVPASEILGQPVKVTTNGVTNTIYLNEGNTARIVTPGGNSVAASWTSSRGELCLLNGTARECWPYTSPFRAGETITLTSSCRAVSTWSVAATNAPAAMERGERGR